MPVLDDGDEGDDGEYGVRHVPGVYAAQLEQKRRQCRPDPRLMSRVHSSGEYCTSPGVVCDHEPIPVQRPPLLDDLEAGLPVVVQGWDLRGHSLPDVHLRRDQAFDWFEVRPDDTIRPCPPPPAEGSSSAH